MSRSALLRLASALPKGDSDRRTLLKMADALTFDRAGKLDQVDPMLAEIMVESGLGDGNVQDDKIRVSKGSWAAASLKPSQTSMVLGKAIGMALGMLASGKVGGDLGALVSKDGYIMDGHHRWAATILASGSRGQVGGFSAALPGKDLLKVLNVATKGLFRVRNGKPGKGNLGDFTPKKVSEMLQDFAENGIGGKFPIPAPKVQQILTDNFGSVEKGIATMAKHSEMVTKSTPSWAPARKQMPVIEPENVDKAVSYMNKGKIDWNDPYKAAALRLASELPKGSEERRAVLAGLKKLASE